MKTLAIKVFVGLAVVGGAVGCLLAGESDDEAPAATPPDTDANTGGAAGAGGSSGSIGGESGTVGCPSTLPGPALVEIPAPNGMKYCIDSTEVTQSQYAEFLSKVAEKPGSEHISCADNKTYSPPTDPYDSIEPKTCDIRFWTPDKTPNQPVVCVAWCDAYAYCAWAGKRLCGKIGGGSGALSAEPAASNPAKDASTSQWYRACTQGGKTKYPYGDNYDPDACEGNVAYGTPKEDVATNTGCRGSDAPYSGLFDMSGSVHELTDECYTFNAGDPAAIMCAARGGSFSATSAGTLVCTTLGDTSPDRVAPDLGFRCCKDLP